MKANDKSHVQPGDDSPGLQHSNLNMHNFQQFPSMPQQFNAQASGQSLANLSDTGLSCSSFPNAFSSIGSFSGNIGLPQSHPAQGTGGMQNAAFVVNSSNTRGNGGQNANPFPVNSANVPQLPTNNQAMMVNNNIRNTDTCNTIGASNIHSQGSQQSPLNHVRDIQMLWKGMQEQNNSNKQTQSGGNSMQMGNTNPSPPGVTSSSESYTDTSARMKMSAMQNLQMNMSAASNMQPNGMMNNLQMKMLMQQMCQNQGNDPSQIQQMNHHTQPMNHLKSMQFMQGQPEVQQMHLQNSFNNPRNQSIATGTNQVSRGNAPAGMNPEKIDSCSDMGLATVDSSQQGSQTMTPEEQLIQHSKLITQIEKKIAEHRMQMSGNKGTNPQHSTSFTESGTGMAAEQQSNQTPMNDAGGSFPPNMNMHMNIAQQTELFQAQNNMIMQQQKQQNSDNLNFFVRQQQEPIQQVSNETSQQNTWGLADGHNKNENCSNFLGGPERSVGNDKITSFSTPSVTTSADEVKSTSPSSWNWQSNRDMSDRKNVLFAILKVIENVQDRDKKTFEKISVMAKRLEEFLYRSAKSKEEYVDMNTLSKRLHAIARISGIDKTAHQKDAKGQFDHRGQYKNEAPSFGILPQRGAGGKSTMSATAHRRISLLKKNNLQLGGTMDAVSAQHTLSSTQCDGQQGSQQLELIQSQNSEKSMGHINANTNAMGSNRHAINGSAFDDVLKQNNTKSCHPAIAQLQFNLNKAVTKENAKQFPHDPQVEELRKKTIRRQQQRLILLRHASKCTLGDKCESKICPKMVKLWSHMKKCKDNNCTTEHCVTSRYVLNHYRMCKELKRTATCEICAPVMKAIQMRDTSSDNQSNDPLDLLSDSETNEKSAMPFDVQQIAFPPINNEYKTNNVQTKSTLQTEEKHLTLEELQTEEFKLNQQHLLLQRLQQQQEAQLRQHQLSNVQMGSEQAKKLKKQQDLLQKCQQQFIEDQNLLQKLISRHSQLQGKSRKNNDGDRGMPKDTNLVKSRMNEQFKNQQQAQTFDPFLNNVSSGNPPFNDHGKRSIGDFLGSQNMNKNDYKKKKIESSINEKDLDPMPNYNHQSRTPALGKDEGIIKSLLPVVDSLMNHAYGWVFSNPVDPIELGLPDYFDVIKEPMDLGLVKKRLIAGYYKSTDNVVRDVWLVFSNAILYNGDDSDVGKMAVEMLNNFKSSCNKNQTMMQA